MAKKAKVEYVIGSDLDLDVDDVQYQGERPTNERAERIAEETLAELRRRELIPGGKSTRAVGLSALARHALEDYLRSRAS